MKTANSQRVFTSAGIILVMMLSGVSSVDASVSRLLLKHDSLDDAVTKTFYHSNHLGSTAVTTDEDGEELTRVHYYPYGTIRETAAELPTYNFTGKERDTTTGLSYHSARYLSPAFANWTQPDPLFHTLSDKTIELPWQASNPYGYGLGNPINHVDPSGTFLETAFDLGSVAMDVVDIVNDNVLGHFLPFKSVKDNLGENLAALGADSVSLVLPGIPALGQISKGTGKLGKKIVRQSEKASKIKGKKFSKEKEALVDMAKKDKKRGSISKEDMKAYKELNKELKDPFPSNKVRGPEQHPNRPSGKDPHGHVGPVNHIPIE